jgi:hypothetical protein
MFPSFGGLMVVGVFIVKELAVLHYTLPYDVVMTDMSGSAS